jgi:hypothetical protein
MSSQRSFDSRCSSCRLRTTSASAPAAPKREALRDKVLALVTFREWLSVRQIIERLDSTPNADSVREALAPAVANGIIERRVRGRGAPGYFARRGPDGDLPPWSTGW